MLYPFTGRYPITAPFGYSPQYGPTFHEGIDYGMPVGTPLRASIAGTVVFAGTDTHGAGKAVSIQSGSTVVKCFHMSQIAVKYGQKVKAGQNIGESGNTGNSTGPHLHFQVEKDHVPVNPQPLFTKPKESRMVTKTQLEILYEYYLGRNPDAGAYKNVGKLSFESVRNRIKKSAEYKNVLANAKSGKLNPAKHLPDGLRAVYKPVSGDPTSNDEQVKKSLKDKITNFVKGA